ncbi:Predicted arabinose efflux permease, MFS family [Polynucleobacter meluiroseus]|uniref:Predicted arabinose efflux permease, MFS family n=1 Tax=Polynucleobacter meluiroseus TaxID=1938814 RepID=A0A240E0G2_9BURK|nr:MFS transporter [Polynucleobacter meluiroseus]SNX28929.1 Predicted arabinose efflux permease, MFS family [Polynucleobacter meluiroseus]
MNKINELKNKKDSDSYKKVAIAACFGTFLEWYDFLTFATLAVVFGPLFFPSQDPATGLLASLATFGVGMVVRPIGAAIFGSVGDRIGRRPVFIITISLMGVATVCVGFLPTYSQIGIWAPILLVSLRLLQGLSAGGEIGGGAIYLTEHAGDKNRGFKTSFLQLMGPLGVLASTLQITLLQHYLTVEEFQSWGWRVPFWISLLLLLLAFRARMALEETPIFLELSKTTAPSKQPLRDNLKDPQTRKRMFLLFFCISSGGAILFFCMQVYTAIFLKTAVKLPPELVDQLSVIATITLLPLTVFAGWLSDKVGRKPVIVSGLFLGAVLILPAFNMMRTLGGQILESNHNGHPTIFIVAILIGLSAILALVVGPQTAVLAELFPAKSRNSAATLPHNLAAGWIGGLLPLIVTWLNQKWLSDVAGLWYPTLFLALAALVAMWRLPETYKVALLSKENDDASP